jgi:hypothetical protein
MWWLGHGKTRPEIGFAFCSPQWYFAARRFQQVLGVTSCPKTETCHPEDIRGLWHSDFDPCGFDRMRKQTLAEA